MDLSEREARSRGRKDATLRIAELGDAAKDERIILLNRQKERRAATATEGVSFVPGSVRQGRVSGGGRLGTELNQAERSAMMVPHAPLSDLRSVAQWALAPPSPAPIPPAFEELLP